MAQFLDLQGTKVLVNEIKKKANLNSPKLTGVPTAPTVSEGTNTDQIATTKFVKTAIENKTSISGNAGTATKLEIERTIELTGAVTGSVGFDGSKNVTIKTTTNHTHTKKDIGLGNVDNTSDLNKPISTATQAALDNKSNIGHTHTKSEIKDMPTKLSQFANDSGFITIDQVDTSKEHTHDNKKVLDKITQDSLNTWYDKYTKNEIDNKISQVITDLDWKESVETFDDLSETYPNPDDGWTVNVKDTDITYRWSGTEWIAISANSIPLATSTTDGKMSKQDKIDHDDMVTKRHTHTNKNILDSIVQSVIDNWNSAYAHISDTVKHITKEERILWNTVSNKLDKTANAVSASKLQNARTITLDGAITGSASFDGSNNITIKTSGISAIPTEEISKLF